MGVSGRSNDNRVYFRVIQQVTIVTGDAGLGILLTKTGQTFRIQVAERGKLCARNLGQVTG